MAFIGYYKGDYELHALERRDPIITAASSDFGAPGRIIDFQAPLAHTLVADKIKRKGKFEKMFVDGRPPVNVGVTSGGDLFGGSAVTFSDVLGDQQFNMFAASVSQYRTFSLSYLNLERRFNYALQGFSQTQFFYGQLEGVFYDPSFSGIIDRDFAIATRTVRGGTAFGIWPFNRYRRVEVFGGMHAVQRELQRPGPRRRSDATSRSSSGSRSCATAPSCRSASTTCRRRRSSASSGRCRATPCASPTRSRRRSATRCRARPPTSTPASTSASAARDCWRCARTVSRAGATAPDFMYFGGNSEMRGYDYLSFLGSEAAFFNAELRFPLIHAMLTPLGVMGGIRGVLFANMGGGSFEGQPFKWWTNKDRALHADHRLPPDQPDHTGTDLRAAAARSAACGWWMRARPTASASRRSPSASPSTSTGRGRRCSTATGRT